MDDTKVTFSNDLESNNSGAEASAIVPIRSTHSAKASYRLHPSDTEKHGKSSILWNDFSSGLKRRKRLIKTLMKKAAYNEGTTDSLKLELLELRQLTLRIVEDYLEIEYRTKLTNEILPNNSPKSRVTNFIGGGSKVISNNRDAIFALAEMLFDCDDLLLYPAVRSFLPNNFPLKRNAFLFGKSIDDLSDIQTPLPESNNISEELRVLELMRYKRAAKALLRAEVEVTNNLPISLDDVETMLLKRAIDPKVDLLFRSVCTLLYNCPSICKEGPGILFLSEGRVTVDAEDLLKNLNLYKSIDVPEVNIQAATRVALKDLDLDKLNTDNPAIIFFVEWLMALLGPFGQSSSSGDNKFKKNSGSLLPKFFHNSSPHNKNVHALNGGKLFTSPTAHNMGLFHELLDDNSSDTGKDGEYSAMNKLPAIRRRGGVLTHRNTTRSTHSPNNELTHSEHENEHDSRHSSGGDDRVSSSGYGEYQHNIGGTVSGIKRAVDGLGGTRYKEGSDEIWSKVRTEVEVILKKFGIGRHHEHVGDNGEGSNNNSMEMLEPETLSAVRYELMKLQQELMRRKVIDPRYYSSLSADTLFNQRSHESQMVTLQNRDTDKSFAEATTASAPHKMAKLSGNSKIVGMKGPPKSFVKRVVHLMDSSVILSNGDKGHVELVLDPENEILVGKIHRLYDQDADLPFKMKKKKLTELNRQTIAYTRISKLMINRLMNTTVEGVRNFLVQGHLKPLVPIMKQLKERAVEDPPPRGRIVIEADRVLVDRNVVSNGLAANIVIARNEDCTGLILTCTPLVQLSAGESTQPPVGSGLNHSPGPVGGSPNEEGVEKAPGTYYI